MPSMIILKDVEKKDLHVDADNTNGFKDIHLLVKEEDFPMEGVYQLQKKAKSYVNNCESCTKEEIITIARDTIEDFFGTLVPFKLYLVSY